MNEGHGATDRGGFNTQHNEGAAQNRGHYGRDDMTASAMPELPPLNNAAATAEIAVAAAIQGTNDELNGRVEEQIANSNNSDFHAEKDTIQNNGVAAAPLPDADEQLKKAARQKRNQHDEKWNQHIKGSLLASDVSFFVKPAGFQVLTCMGTVSCFCLIHQSSRHSKNNTVT